MKVQASNYFTALLTLLLFSPLSLAEVYSWIDENGKTNYGDHIPEQYQEQAATVEIEVDNSYTHDDIQFKPDPTISRKKNVSRETDEKKKKKAKKKEARSYGVSTSDLESIKAYCAKKFPDDSNCIDSQSYILRRNALKNKGRPYYPSN